MSIIMPYLCSGILMFKIFFVRRKPVFSFFLVLFLQYFSQPLLAADGDYYFPALGYRDTSNQCPVQNSPQETWNGDGSALKRSKLPYSYSWIPGSQGDTICQRYVSGIKDSAKDKVEIEPSEFRIWHSLRNENDCKHATRIRIGTQI